jgi:oligosaccharide repeat unit polymerase
MIFVYFIVVFACLTSYFFLNNKKLGFVGFMILIYMASATSSLIIFLFFDGRDDIKIYPTIYFLILLIIIFYGFWGIKDRNLKSVVVVNIRFVKVLDFSLMFSGIMSLAFFIYSLFELVIGGIDVKLVRQAIGSGQFSPLEKYGLINSVASLCANLFVFNIVFFYFNLMSSYPRSSNLKAYVHLVSSFSYVFYIFNYLGRDGVIYWCITFLMLTSLFSQFLKKRTIRKILVIAFILAVPMFFIFLLISFYRFSSEGLLFSLFDYSGQQIFNFSDQFYLDFPLLHGEKSFQKLYEFYYYVSGNSYVEFNRDAWNSYFFDESLVPWVFATFFGSWIHDFGKIGTLLLVIFFALISRNLTKEIKKYKSIKFSNLIALIVFMQIVSWGVFYYRQYSAFYYLLFIFLIFLILKFSGGTPSVTINKER